MIDFDEELPGLMRRATATVDPPSVRATVAAGVERGRRLRRRRRLVVTSQAAVGAGIVAGIAALVVQFVNAPPEQNSAPSIGGFTATAARSPDPTPAPPASVPLTPQVAAATLMQLLPGTGQLTHLTGATPMPNFVNGDYLYDDGHGTTEILLGVGWHSDNPMYNAAPPCPTAGDGCKIYSDGSQLATNAGPQYPDRSNPGPWEWSAQFQNAEGLYVALYERNAASKDGAITRSEPPFTMAQLIAIVESSQWSSTTTPATAAADAHLFTPAKDTPQNLASAARRSAAGH